MASLSLEHRGRGHRVDLLQNSLAIKELSSIKGLLSVKENAFD